MPASRQRRVGKVLDKLLKRLRDEEDNQAQIRGTCFAENGWTAEAGCETIAWPDCILRHSYPNASYLLSTGPVLPKIPPLRPGGDFASERLESNAPCSADCTEIETVFVVVMYTALPAMKDVLHTR